ncbi:MAG: hypothetical protein ACOC0P_00580, partial [Planctomycetota bacterium]
SGDETGDADGEGEPIDAGMMSDDRDDRDDRDDKPESGDGIEEPLTEAGAGMRLFAWHKRLGEDAFVRIFSPEALRLIRSEREAADTNESTAAPEQEGRSESADSGRGN